MMLATLIRDWLSPQGIIALGVIYTAFQGWRASSAVAKVSAKIEEVHLATNGMSHRIETLAGQVGVAEGREQMRVEREKER
jgi:hypothetical protein